LPSDSSTLWFATSNRNKFHEAQSVLSRYGISLRHLRRQKTEIQSRSLTTIARFAAEKIAVKESRIVVVEDSGLFVEAIGGFPGPFSSYVLTTIGLSGMLRLIHGFRNRSAYFQAAIALSFPGSGSAMFTGYARGRISKKARGSQGFGYDPIFIRNGATRTFAEMGLEYKNRYSHRAVAFGKLARWCRARGIARSETTITTES